MVSRSSIEKLIPILVNRTVFFFFSMCLLVLAVYAAGTVQGFIDTTQHFLLSLYVFLGIFLTIASIGGIAVTLGRFIRNRKFRYLLRSGGYMLLMLFGSITVLVIIFIITATNGNSGK